MYCTMNSTLKLHTHTEYIQKTISILNSVKRKWPVLACVQKNANKILIILRIRFQLQDGIFQPFLEVN
jgi:hypothetical protein